MTLTEFLLARIAEDERDLMLHDWMCDSVNPTPFPCTCGWDKRFPAECEAKRRIIDWAAPELRNWPNAPDGFRYVNEEARELLCILALPYADHPDYRSEWKP